MKKAVLIVNGTVVISANKDGLRSLAEQLTALAEEPLGSHIHYDEHGLEKERTERKYLQSKEGKA